MKARIRMVVGIVAFGCVPALADEAVNPSASVTYEQDVRPILKAHCFQCHGEEGTPKAGLDVRLRRLIAAGGKSGAAIVPGKAEQSLIYQRVSKREMPPGEKKLSAEEIEVIGRWIAEGAKTARAEPAEIGEMLITEEERSFWAFQPVKRSEVPEVTPPRLPSEAGEHEGSALSQEGEHVGSATSQAGEATRVRTAIDAFLLAKLREKGLSFAPEADKRTLIRRATFDLLGLPPTPEEVAAFLADASPEAYERLIDRLLASPHYGERWGRHWLDVAGYADSEGYTNEDEEREWAYKYRDYVIRSFNADKPFDEFIQEQLAGDEMVAPPYDDLARDEVEKLIATGFLRMAPDGTGERDVDQGLARNQVVAETIEIVSTSLLGLTVGCAQCHNHRYDPIPQRDYYRFRAIFEPAYDWKRWRKPKERLVSLYTEEDRKQAVRIENEAIKIDRERRAKQREFIERTFEKELAKLPEEIREPIRAARETPEKKRTEEQKRLLKENPSVNVTAGSLYLYDSGAANELKEIAAKAAQLRATKPKEEFVRAMTEAPGHVPPTHLFFRGDHEQPKEELAPGELAVLGSDDGEVPVDDPALKTTGRRLAYARHLTDGDHPLTARVLVNRVWAHHFGQGIVATLGDFGMLGERPTHPELLDWLASEFAARGWRLKELHKLIMTSTVYRQSSRRHGDGDAVDPDNRLYWHMPVRRLEAEAVRDAILAVSGKLNDKMFGPPVPVMADKVGQFVIGKENLVEGRPGPVQEMQGEEFRRSVYVQVRRSRPLAVLDTFDMPPMDPNCEARNSSTVTPQALLLMNSEFVGSYAGHFADRIRREAGDDVREQAKHAWRLAYADEPSAAELDEAVAFLTEQAEHFQTTTSSDESKDKKNATGEVSPQQRALAVFCQALISANAFLYVD